MRENNFLFDNIDESNLKEMGISREEYCQMISEMNDQLLGYSIHQENQKIEESFENAGLDDLFLIDTSIQKEIHQEGKHLSKKARQRRNKKQYAPMKDVIPLEFVNPTQFWPNYEEIIRKRISKYCPTNVKVLKITNITNYELLERFRKTIQSEKLRLSWEESQINLMKSIELGLHGTESSNIESILTKGLLIPGQNNNNIRIRNGQSSGWGIYLTLTDPRESIHYCRGGGKMIACAVLLSDRLNVSHHNDFVVIREESYVLPCFLVEFLDGLGN